MNKSTKNSDIDIDVSSIFNRQSPRPGSPFLPVSPLIGSQYNFSRNRAAQPDASRLYGKLFRAPDFGTIFDGGRVTDHQKSERANLPSFHDWLAPSTDLRNSNLSALGAIGQGSKSAQTQLSSKDLAFDKYKGQNPLAAKGISTASMVMVNPKSKQESGNFYVKENIGDSDEHKFNLTTFYLKRFNMFSNSCTSLATVDEISDEPLKSALPSRKIKKLFSKQSLPKNKTKGTERRSRRKITCNCKNSKCVKMYCECFRENGYCGSHCKCKDCQNFENSVERANNIISVNRKQAEEFAFKLSKDEIAAKTTAEPRGCKCKKSQCQKKYCECFSEGGYCGADCCCVDCLNIGRK